MTEEAFRAKRRQPFLTERYFELNEIDIARSIRNNETVIAEERDTGKCDSSSYGSRFKNTLKLLRLHYTAGESIETLKSPYADTMKWFTEWHRAEEEYSRYLAMKSGKDLRLDMTPLHFEDLCHFQLALDVVSVGVLLGEGDAVRQAAKLMDSSRGSDMLFEAIIESAVTDPRDVDEFFHVKPYDPLLDAIYTAETPEQASAFVKTYLEGWYKSFEGVPWHDGHTVVTDEYMAYEGYWAFEAAAVCVLYGIDDSSFRDHIVYPKDLADWARAHEVVNRIKPDAPGAATTPATANRCGAGQPCPREGWWFTPAKQDSRRYFKQGEIMPDMKSEAWATIWQWDEHNQ
jgi:hypothetical protein